MWWVKASASTGHGDCVEVAASSDKVFVRNSRHPFDLMLGFTKEEWAAFLEGVSNGEFAAERLEGVGQAAVGVIR